MKPELPVSIIKLAESLSGRFVTSQTHVFDAEIIVAVSCSHSSSPDVPVTLEFIFLDRLKQTQFKHEVFRAYGNPSLFAPWTLGEYLSQPAKDYFSRFGGGNGPTPPAMVASKTTRNPHNKS